MKDWIQKYKPAERLFQKGRSEFILIYKKVKLSNQKCGSEFIWIWQVAIEPESKEALQ